MSEQGFFLVGTDGKYAVQHIHKYGNEGPFGAWNYVVSGGFSDHWNTIAFSPGNLLGTNQIVEWNYKKKKVVVLNGKKHKSGGLAAVIHWEKTSEEVKHL